MEERAPCAAYGRTDHGCVEWVAQLQRDTEHGRFGDAQQGADTGCGTDRFQLDILRLEQHGQDGCALGDIVHGGSDEDEASASDGDGSKQLRFDRDE